MFLCMASTDVWLNERDTYSERFDDTYWVVDIRDQN